MHRTALVLSITSFSLSFACGTGDNNVGTAWPDAADAWPLSDRGQQGDTGAIAQHPEGGAGGTTHATGGNVTVTGGVAGAVSPVTGGVTTDGGSTGASTVSGDCWWHDFSSTGGTLGTVAEPDGWPASPKRTTSSVSPQTRVDTWTNMSSTNAPSGPRLWGTAVWTGEEMIVWGGWISTLNRFEATGARYNPTLDKWTPMSTSNAPKARREHAAVWTGKEMLVWGGWDGQGNISSGGRYDPKTDTWTILPTASAPQDFGRPQGVWTGSEWLIWPGSSSSKSSGTRFDPVANTWRPMASKDAPIGQDEASVAWTGKEMIVWGGYTAMTSLDDSCDSARGAIYDPSGDSWRTMVFQGAPHPRSEHSAVWTGSEMFVWGGTNYSPNAASYDPAKGVWVGMSEKEAPSPRQWPTLIFLAGDGANGLGRMIVWGGGSQQDAATGEIYDIASDSWLPMAQFPVSVKEPNISAPSTTVWTGKEMITWDVGEGVGARYTP